MGWQSVVDATLQATLSASQIELLGLAKDTSVQAVKTTLGTPAQTVDVVATLPANIAATGVPLITSANLLQNLSGTILANSTFSPPALAPDQIGYEIIFQLRIPAGAANPFAQVTLTWSDSASGLITGIEEWWLGAGSGATNQNYIGHGPTKGDQLAVTIKNFETVQTLTYTYAFLQNSRVYLRDDWRQISYATVPGFTNGTADPNGNILLTATPSVTTASPATRIMPLYAGLVSVQCSAETQPATFTIASVGDQAAGGVIWSLSLLAGAQSNSQVSLPRSVCTLEITNTGSATGTFFGNATIQEMTV